jgi:hypothetical protein
VSKQTRFGDDSETAPVISESPRDLEVQNRAAVRKARAFTRKLAFLIPPIIFLFFTLVLGYKDPGLQYDEAAYQTGAVRLLNAPARRPIALSMHLKVGEWYLPLMIVPYAGAAKNYLLLLPYSIFGTGVWVGRAVAALLAAGGVLGVTYFLSRYLPQWWSVAAGICIAIHPSLINWTLYDNGGLALWMFNVGFVLFSLVRFLERRSHGSAFLLGFAIGFSIWSRANFLWLVIAILVAQLVVKPRYFLDLLHRIPMMCLGGFVGVVPLVIYEVQSSWETFDFMRATRRAEPLVELVSGRMGMLFNASLYDLDRRGMWDGPPIPSWQLWFVCLAIITAANFALLIPRDDEKRTNLRRVATVGFLLVLLITMTSRLEVNAHHLVSYVPLVAAVVILGGYTLTTLWPMARWGVLAAGVLYLSLALFWNVQAARGFRRTGGVGQWSSAITTLADYLMKNDIRHPKALDWGFATNLYVLSNSRVKPEELFWGNPSDGKADPAYWSEELEQGGTFLMHSEEVATTQFGGVAKAFLRRLGDQYSSRLYFPQRSGQPFAEFYSVRSRPILPELAEEFVEGAFLAASPNPIVVCDQTGLGTTELQWASNVPRVELRVGSPSGALMTYGAASGSAKTDKWVADGTTVYLLDGSRRSKDDSTVLARIVLRVTTQGCR